MKVVVTGSAGFLGWHTRVRLSTVPDLDVVAVDRDGFGDQGRLHAAVRDADAVLHLAGINRADPDQVERGNLTLAEHLVTALEATGAKARVAYAGSTQADGDSPYGRGKRGAGQRLLDWGRRCGADVCEVRLPGLYGEHGRPDYNSFVATFAHRIAAGQEPEVTGDRAIPLLHVQDAAAHLLAAAGIPPGPADAPNDLPGPKQAGEVFAPPTQELGISWVRDQLTDFRRIYDRGEIPPLPDRTDVALFNTLRAAMWDRRTSIPLTPRTDQRGTLVEVVRQHGGQGQTFVSTSNPGVRRGDHFHFHKIERFVVVSGQGLIRLRKMLTSEVLDIPVTGDGPVAVDMPTLWTHSIENTGPGNLLTLFWVNELFDPDHPDTHPEPVLQEDRT